MIIDTSAIMAVLNAENDAALYAEAIEAAPQRLMSAVSHFEATIVQFSRRGEQGLREFDLLILRAKIEAVPFDLEQSEIARDAFKRFGRGQNRARLNFGDCMSYALARSRGLPLLYKGEDFKRTDIRAALDNLA